MITAEGMMEGMMGAGISKPTKLGEISCGYALTKDMQ